MLNQARLKVLKVREDHVSTVLEEARKRLGEVTRNPAKYGEVLKLLMVQGLLQLLEPTVTIRIREADQAHAESLVGSVEARYKEISGKDLILKIDGEIFLPVDTCGGVELVTQRGRIKISNTLESRLDLIAQQLIPDIRSALFGRNPNRKFTD